MPELIVGEKGQGEGSRHVIACNDYLRMGPGRSLAKLQRRYVGDASSQPPTKHLRTLATWSSRYGWQARAEAYDAHIEAEKTARVEEILASGAALVHERVQKLKDLLDFLEREIAYESDRGSRDKVWLPDVKQIGGGEHAERVDLVRFNSALIDQYRATLDDLAKETGGRKQQMDVTSQGDQIAFREVVAILPPEGEEADE